MPVWRLSGFIQEPALILLFLFTRDLLNSNRPLQRQPQLSHRLYVSSPPLLQAAFLQTSLEFCRRLHQTL